MKSRKTIWPVRRWSERKKDNEIYLKDNAGRLSVSRRVKDKRTGIKLKRIRDQTLINLIRM